jgi:transposase-like protein
MEKIPPSKAIRNEIRGILEEGVGRDGSVLDALLERGTRLVMQELLEGEVKDFLGREHYARREEGEEHRGYRNGYEPGRIKTAEGELRVSVPQVRDTVEEFQSKLRKFLGTHTDVMKRLAAEMYARGLSTRDVEDALFEATGDKVLSRTSVSELTEVLWEEYEAFCRRSLAGYEVIYLFLDAIYESVRKQFGTKEAILVAWGVCTDGRKVLLSMALGNKESKSSWLEFLRGMRARGLTIPLAVTSDGCPGLLRAVDEVFPLSVRVRCWYHRMGNFRDKVPEEVWPQIKVQLEGIRDATDYEEGKERYETFVGKYTDVYPSLVKSLLEDRAILGHLMVAVRHRKCVRTTNLIERSFEEERRRTKVIPGFLTEKSALKLVFSVLIRAAKRWQRIPMNALEPAHVQSLRDERGITRELAIEKKAQTPETKAV